MKLHRASIACVLLASATLALPAPAQDLGITVLADRTRVRIGETVTFLITMTNLGPATATGIVFGDSLPGPFQVVSFSCSQGSLVNQSFCSVPSLAAGASVTAILVATPIRVPAKNEKILTNIAIIAQSDTPDPNSGNNAALLELHITSKLH